MLLCSQQIELSNRVVDTVLVRDDRNLVLGIGDQLEWAKRVLAAGGVVIPLELLCSSRVENAGNSTINQFAVEGMVMVAGDNSLGSGHNGGDIMNQVVKVISLLGCDGEPADTGSQEGGEHAEGNDDNAE